MQNACYAAINHVTDLSENKHNVLEGLKDHVPELWLVDLDPFCLLDVNYNNNWQQPKM